MLNLALCLHGSKLYNLCDGSDAISLKSLSHKNCILLYHSGDTDSAAVMCTGCIPIFAGSAAVRVHNLSMLVRNKLKLQFAAP